MVAFMCSASLEPERRARMREEHRGEGVDEQGADAEDVVPARGELGRDGEEDPPTGELAPLNGDCAPLKGVEGVESPLTGDCAPLPGLEDADDAEGEDEKEAVADEREDGTPRAAGETVMEDSSCCRFFCCCCCSMAKSTALCCCSQSCWRTACCCCCRWDLGADPAAWCAFGVATVADAEVASVLAACICC